MSLPDELFDATPDEFVTVRDELAKRLRSEGDKDAAALVKKARKLSVSVWALDNLARQRPDRIAAVLDAGETLRRAQEELQADELRRGTGLLRDAIAGTVDEAAALASERGVKVPAAQKERMRDTLFAASTSGGEEAEQLRAGRLVEDMESIGFVGSISASGSRSATRSAPDPSAEARRRVGEAEVAAREAADAARRARRNADDLERDAAEARLRATNLEEEAERAGDAASDLEERAAAAEADLEEARSLLS